MREAGSTGSCQVIPFRRERIGTLDSLRWAKKGMHIPTLMEVDVTDARKRIRALRNQTGQGVSLTAWVVSCVARAAAEHPRVHALRRGKRHLVLFGEVDVSVLVERRLGDGADAETLPMPFVVRKANEKEPTGIHEEIRRAREVDLVPGSASIEQATPSWLQAVFFRMPGPVRDLMFWRWLLRSPMRVKSTMGTVVVTATGMAAPGVLAWGVPLSLHPLAVGIGGIARRGTEEGDRQILALTIVFDHAVTDGAPVGRFIRRLHQMMTRAEGLSQDGSWSR